MADRVSRMQYEIGAAVSRLGVDLGMPFFSHRQQPLTATNGAKMVFLGRQMTKITDSELHTPDRVSFGQYKDVTLVPGVPSSAIYEPNRTKFGTIVHAAEYY